MTDKQRLSKFLGDQQYMVLAVTLDDGSPWAVPVRIRAWNGKEFEWDSKLDTVHSKAIEARPEVAMTIFQKLPDSQFGFYAKGRGELVEAKDHGMGRYRFTAERAWINDETFVKQEVEL